MGSFLRSVLIIVAGALGAAPAAAQSVGFDPRSSCTEILNESNDITRALAASWTFGFITSKQDDPRPVDVENMETVLKNLDEACANNPNASLLALVGHSAKPGPDTPGSEAHARVLLEEFLQPGANLALLTAEIFPTEADIRAVYQEPLASRLVQSYSDSFVPGVQLGPNPGQTDLFVVHATTAQLIRGEPVLGDFPGGYERVLNYLNPDYPIVRFKFVKPGETSGMAFDGLVFVNDHWVIMPKPWRMVE